MNHIWGSPCKITAASSSPRLDPELQPALIRIFIQSMPGVPLQSASCTQDALHSSIEFKELITVK